MLFLQVLPIQPNCRKELRIAFNCLRLAFRIAIWPAFVETIGVPTICRVCSAQMRPGTRPIAPATGHGLDNFWYTHVGISNEQDQIADTALRIAVLCLR